MWRNSDRWRSQVPTLWVEQALYGGLFARTSALSKGRSDPIARASLHSFSALAGRSLLLMTPQVLQRADHGMRSICDGALKGCCSAYRCVYQMC